MTPSDVQEPAHPAPHCGTPAGGTPLSPPIPGPREEELKLCLGTGGRSEISSPSAKMVGKEWEGGCEAALRGATSRGVGGEGAIVRCSLGAASGGNETKQSSRAEGEVRVWWDGAGSDLAPALVAPALVAPSWWLQPWWFHPGGSSPGGSILVVPSPVPPALVAPALRAPVLCSGTCPKWFSLR